MARNVEISLKFQWMGYYEQVAEIWYGSVLALDSYLV